MAIKRHTPYSERVLFNWSISHMEFSANLISSICPAVNAIAKSIYMKEGGNWGYEVLGPRNTMAYSRVCLSYSPHVVESCTLDDGCGTTEY